MIYIFDDRAGRRDLYSKILNRYSSIIKPHILNLKEEGDFDESFIEKYGDADLIVLHSSYRISGGRIKSEEIRDYFLKNGLNVVTFSGGTDMNDVNHKKRGIHYNMNAERMYENLEIFLKDYELHRELNIELLLWGKQYILNQLLSFQWKLGKLFINDDLNDSITNDKADDIIEFIEDSLPSESLADFKVRVEECIETGFQKSLTPQQLIDFISNLLKDYKRW